VDGDGVLSQEVKDADLQHAPVTGGSDEHRQFVAHDDVTHGVADSVEDVVIGHPVVPGWFTDSHLDNIACLSYNDRGVIGRRAENWSAAAAVAGDQRTAPGQPIKEVRHERPTRRVRPMLHG
jgi:hypothetical protein